MPTISIDNSSPCQDAGFFLKESSAYRPVSWTSEILGESELIERTRQDLYRSARCELPVLIRGESGTGKELAAKTIHDSGLRADGPLITVNCAAIPENLAESELFGHCRGSFTGAQRDHRGAFARARRGTLFLDEVGELPPSVQAKLLRVLETGRYLPIGAESDERSDARIVSATHRPLELQVRRGYFREDLFYRLAVLDIRLPALRERIEDIPLLIQKFIRQAARELRKPVEIDPSAILLAQQFHWPGNVRALRNAILRAAVLSDGNIDEDSLAASVATRAAWDCAISGPEVVVRCGRFEDMRRDLLRQVVTLTGSIRQAATQLDIPKSTLAGWMGVPDRMAV